ncbi:hypothetical protein NW762_002357 [Fusarium torreyae]|uniref:Monooxygenase n=1 Tax=Fusarium torreyae TaxID=1237075 RepID=A0A9W8VMJ7_9HYPO|nr:hypothetical protein NW762_002357 [Fusarium torreyae]
MKNADFRPKLEPTSRPLTFSPKAQAGFMLKDSIKPHTIIIIGSIIQLALCAILPLRWAAVPPAALLLNSIVTTITQLRSPQPNEYTEAVIPGRTTAQLPFSSGAFGNRPSASSVVVFHLGLQVNHPLGIAAPGFKEIGQHFAAMQQELTIRQDEYGMIGRSNWRGNERSSNNTLLNVYYFRDVEGLHRFAHCDVHRKAWDFFNKSKLKHIGVFHETFCVPAKEYENVYVNCHPVLMGRATVRTTPVGEDKERWTNALVSADMPALRTQYARMARDEQGRSKAID